VNALTRWAKDTDIVMDFTKWEESTQRKRKPRLNLLKIRFITWEGLKESFEIV
jgi:hypothetical protein